MATLKTNNRNCFHLACLNRYQGCFNTIELMFEELNNFDLRLDHTTQQYYEQINSCFPENSRVDPRLFEDTLSLIQEALSPHRLQEIKKLVAKKVEEEIEIILSSKDKDG